MADGTGDDGGPISLAGLKQLAWDLGYITKKLAHNGVYKSLMVRRKDGGFQFSLGKIDFIRWDWVAGFRALADSIAAGDDGPSPAVENFGQSSFTASALESMHSDLAAALVNQVQYNKRTFTLRLSTEGYVEITLGGIETESSTYRLAIKSMGAQLAAGQN